MQSYLKKALIIALIAAVAIPSLASASRFRGSNIGGGTYLIDTTGDGIGDTRPEPGTGMGAGAATDNFVDADNDGIADAWSGCDTFAEGGDRLLDGSARPDIAEMRSVRQERQIRQAR